MKAAVLVQIPWPNADLGPQTIMPDSMGIQPFLGCEVDGALVVNRLDCVRIAAQYAEVGQQLAHRAGFLGGERQIVRAPGISGNGVCAAAGVTADFRLQFQQHEVGKAGLLQLPASGQTGNAAADDDHRGFQRLGRFGQVHGPQPVADGIGRAEDIAGGQRRRLGRTPLSPGISAAGRGGGGNPERAQKLAAVH